VPDNRVLFEEVERVAVIKLNSPITRNAIDAHLAQEVLDACNRINENDDVCLW